jgi:polysaccharide export outer membrane protein
VSTTTIRQVVRHAAAAVLVATCAWGCAAAAGAQAPAVPARPGAATGASDAVVSAPANYVIGPDDVLTIVFWRDKDLSGDVAVRPDGRISLPLINEIEAAGLTPEQLRVRVQEAADKFLQDPTVTVQVKQINSRKVFITGQVPKQGAYPLIGPTTVLQLLAMAGGVLEYADDENIVIMRTENGRHVTYRFNYDEVIKRRNLRQNIELRPGDTILVP